MFYPRSVPEVQGTTADVAVEKCKRAAQLVSVISIDEVSQSEPCVIYPSR
jgi:hypothetical protein